MQIAIANANLKYKLVFHIVRKVRNMYICIYRKKNIFHNIFYLLTLFVMFEYSDM